MQESLERAVIHWKMVAPIVETPEKPEDYEALLQNLKQTIELVENRPNSPLAGLIKAMSRAAKEYEETNLTASHQGALSALQYLVKLHGIRQSDLKEVGSQGVVSELLNGKRSLTLRHVKEFAKRFNVSPAAFIDA